MANVEQPDLERLRLRPKDVSARYGMSLSQVYQAIYRGELPARRFRQRTWLIVPADVEAWILANSTPNRDEAAA